MATWTTFLTKLSTGLVIASSKAVQELQTWSTPLVELTTAFSEIAPKFEITTFFEQKKTHGVLVRHLQSAWASEMVPVMTPKNIGCARGISPPGPTKRAYCWP